MPKVKQPKTSQVTDTGNLIEEGTALVKDTENHATQDTTHTADDDLRKKRIAEIRRKWTETRAQNKAKE
eukprot:3067784-Pleurochrysis_carterae.AAC.1